MSDTELAQAVKRLTPLLPVPMDLTLLVENLAADLHRTVRLTGAAFSSGSTTGALVKQGPNDDLIIIFDEGADPAHQIHIVLHEIGHLLLGHPLIAVPAEGLTNLLAHPLSCPYPKTVEDAAEQFATSVVAVVSVMPSDTTELSRASSILL